MRPRYKVSQAGVDLIEAFEGLRAKAARLDDGRWTIGYGHTRSAREGAEVSRDDALMLLRWVDLPPVEEAINALVAVPLTQAQYDALVAFVFNVGVDAFGESEVLEHLNDGRLTEAACALELWRKADIAGDPVVLDSLIRRRAAEKALFLACGEGVTPTPSPLVRPRPDARAAQFVPARRPAEIEAPLAGERAEVRLVAPYEVEPDLEAPEPVEPEPSAGPAPEEEAPTVQTAEAAAASEAEETPDDAAAPIAATAGESSGEEETPTAEAAEPEAGETLEGAAASDAAPAVVAGWAAEIAEVAVQPEVATAPDTASMAWTVKALEQPAQETAEEAPTAWTADVVEQAEPLPTAWSIELPHAASVAPEAPASVTWTAEPAETDWEEPAPSSWIPGVTRLAEPAPAAAESAAEAAAEAENPAALEVAPEVAPEAAPEAASEAESVAEAEAPAIPEDAPETPPVEAPAPEEIVREIPAVGSVLQTRSLPEASPRPRPLYSSYGPMAFAVAPPPAPTETAPAAAGVGAATAAPQPVQPQPAQPASFHRQPLFQPLPTLTAPASAPEPAPPVQSVAPPAPAPAQAQAPATASAPAATADAAPAKPLILTSPPADWEEPRAASTDTSVAAEADELETPLFDEGWDGPGALRGRIVHHEAPAEHDARAAKRGLAGPYVLLGFIGFVAFGGALFAFSRGRAAGGGAGDPVVLAWALMAAGVVCVGISAYFLFKRLGGQED